MMKFAIAQINCWVGNVEYNTNKILEIYNTYHDKVDILIFPEMSLSGYPVEDMVWDKNFMTIIENNIKKITNATVNSKCGILFGTPVNQGGLYYNAAILAADNSIKTCIYKSELPNYGVFDEKRTFINDKFNQPVEFKGIKLGIMVCEDLWFSQVPLSLKQQNASVLIAINASPFEIGKQQKRIEIAHKAVKATNLPIIYVNMVGGQDSLVFDGASFVLNNKGKFIAHAKSWDEEVTVLGIDQPELPFPLIDEMKDLYNAVVLATKDYVIKNGFKKVILGLSGGIDSSIVATIAVDALGQDNVVGLTLPSIYSSSHSLTDANQLAENLGIKIDNISINEIFNSSLNSLAPFPAASTPLENLTQENLQARIRGLMLMAFSNKFGHLLLTTGNKSEYAMGYATIYGDMCGGFAPIKDLYKTQVYALANWRNQNIPNNTSLKKTEVIPQNCISKAPSAELKPNQTDQDTLPPYEVLDAILYLMIECNLSISEVIKQGFEHSIVRQAYNALLKSEYKRKQSALGPKISVKDLGKDRRFPVTNYTM